MSSTINEPQHFGAYFNDHLEVVSRPPALIQSLQ